MGSYRNSFIQNISYMPTYTDCRTISAKLLTTCSWKSYKNKRKKINFWKEQISSTYRCCRWSEGKPSFLGQDVYTVIFLCTSLHSILAKSKVIITSQTKVFIKLNVKPDLEMNNENQKTRIKPIGCAQHCINFLKPLPAPSP